MVTSRGRCHPLFFSVFIVSLWFSHRFSLHRYGLAGGGIFFFE